MERGVVNIVRVREKERVEVNVKPDRLCVRERMGGRET